MIRQKIDLAIWSTGTYTYPAFPDYPQKMCNNRRHEYFGGRLMSELTDAFAKVTPTTMEFAWETDLWRKCQC